MVSILLHEFKLNIKRCLLNQSDPILCPNTGNVSLLYGVSFVGNLQRDICVLLLGWLWLINADTSREKKPV